MSTRALRRSIGRKDKEGKGSRRRGTNRPQLPVRSNSRGGIVASTVSKLFQPSASDMDADTSTRNALAGIRRRKAGGGGWRRMPRAGVVVFFSALCAALLWAGVGSLAQPPAAAGGARANSTRGRGGSESKTSTRASSAGAAATETAAGPSARKDGSQETSSRNLSRRPELKTRGGQLAFARFSLLAEYPHDQHAFTQGLCYHGGFLYESTGLYGGKSTVRKVDTETGKVLQSVKLDDEYFGEGMVIIDNKIHSLTWQSKVGFSWDLETLEQQEQFHFNTMTGQGWGVTTDGESLIVSDGSEFLFFWDPATMKETRRVEVKLKDGRPLKKLNELEVVKGYVFANVWFDDNLYKIDPATGEVVDAYSFSELYPKALQKKELASREAVLNGIAWDPEEDVLYLTGKLWPRMYKVKLNDAKADDDKEAGPVSSEGNERRRRQ
ncbi:unnamed protein product [Ectocarpus sp. CCAP 1310/34]|nr:unnamed protein product [Ectocarpus sp. CCAP 1310/34]